MMKQTTKQFLRTAMFSLCAVLFAATAANAATYTVTTTADVVAGSLRQAIDDANASAGVNDTIIFNIPAGDAGCANGVCTLTLVGGLPQIVNAGTLTIDNSAGSSKIVISGDNQFQVLYMQSGSNLTLTALTISNGRSTSVGGAINNTGGTLTINNSTLSGNTAVSEGGAINSSGTLTLNNSTVSGNTGRSSGGILSDGMVTINNSTIAFNTTTSSDCFFGCAGGLYMDLGMLTLANTIIAKNTSNTGYGDFYGQASSSSSYNLIGNGAGMSGITNGTKGNQVGTTAAPVDPLLAALADNGGQTLTHALLTGSPAIDKGNSAAAADQRGAARPADNTSITNATGGNGADIGAVEAPLAPTAANVVISGRVLTPEGRGLMNAVVYVTDATGVTRAARTTTFGSFRFDDIAAGQTIILSVSSKRYQFAPQVLGADEDATEIVLQPETETTKQTARSGAKR